MNTLLKVSQQTVWQLIGKAATSFSTIIILGLVSRSYGESGTGVLTLALAFLGFFVLAADFGVNVHVLPRFLGDNFSNEWRKLLGFRLVLAGFMTATATFSVVLWPFEPQFKEAVLLGSVAILESAVFATAAVIFQSKHRYDLAVIATTAGTLVTLGTVYLLVRLNAGIPVLLLGYSAGWIVNGALAAIFIKGYVKNLSPVFDFKFAREIIKNSWPISLTLILNVVYFRLDAFILTSLKGFAEVGVYNLSYQVFQALLVVPTFIMNGFYPVMLKDFAENKNRFISNLTKACLLMLVVAILGMAFTYLFSPFVIGLITGGKGFVGSVDLLRILSFGFPAFFVSAVLMWTLITLRLYKTMLLIYLAGLITSVFLNVIFIPRYSYFASAWITGFSEYLVLVLQLVILIPLLKSLWYRSDS